MTKKRNYKVLGDFEMEGEEAERINKMIEDADKEIEESRVYFRFGKKQLDVVKKAAALIGIPYQTYIKTIIFNKAIEDIEKTERVLSKI
ncbi:MAG: hypothetical protein AABZ74_14550 [Cyanobacteriota bacterium]